MGSRFNQLQTAKAAAGDWFGYLEGTLRPAISEEEKEAGVPGYTIADWKALSKSVGGATKWPLKLEHDEDVGWLLNTTVDENHILCVHAFVDRSTPKGEEVWQAIVDGRLPSLSIGFDSVPSSSGNRRINTGHHVGITDNPRDKLTAGIRVRASATDPDHNEPLQPFQQDLMSSSSSSAAAAPTPAASAPALVPASSTPADNGAPIVLPSVTGGTNNSGASPLAPVTSSLSGGAPASVASSPAPADAASLPMIDPSVLSNPEVAARLFQELMANKQANERLLQNEDRRAQKKVDKRQREHEAIVQKRKEAVDANAAVIEQIGAKMADGAGVLKESLHILASDNETAPVIEYVNAVSSQLSSTEKALQDAKSQLAAVQADNLLLRTQTQMNPYYQQQQTAAPRPVIAPPRGKVNEQLAAARAARQATVAQRGAPSALDAQNASQSAGRMSEAEQLQAQIQNAQALLQQLLANPGTGAPILDEDTPEPEPQVAPEFAQYQAAMAASDNAGAMKALIAMKLKHLMPGIEIRCNANGRSPMDVLGESHEGGILVPGNSSGIVQPDAWTAFSEAWWNGQADYCRKKLRSEPAYLAKHGVRVLPISMITGGRPEYYEMEHNPQFNRAGRV